MALPHPPSPVSHRQAVAEWLLVFAVFFAQGAYPTPDVNEPYYLGKAIHYWNPDWARGDFFLDSADAHGVFYFTFGWLSLWLGPDALAWTGRLLTWGLLAWAWRRMSLAVVPRRWLAVLTAALFVCLNERGQMAGEWVVGGVEGKGFAYVLVFLGIEALARGRWRRVWILLGAASAFHVLVGGWSVVAAGVAWLLSGEDRPSLRSMAPALALGFALSLPGLLPAAALNHGVAPELARRANEIYVFLRLPHHLVFHHFPVQFVLRFALLTSLWIALWHFHRPGPEGRRVQGFVVGALLIAAAGIVLGALDLVSRPAAAALLRFYWFRLADVAVPLGAALLAPAALLEWTAAGRRGARVALAALLAVAALHVGVRAAARPIPQMPRAYRLSRHPDHFVYWRLACEWAADPDNVPADARFLTPRMTQTFKWYAGRAEVANWKEVPQDAGAIVAWWERIRTIYYTGIDIPHERWHEDLHALGAERLVELGRRYDAQYAIAARRRHVEPLDLPVVYRNRGYIIYRLR
jgi:hypothetical protein